MSIQLQRECRYYLRNMSGKHADPQHELCYAF